ncbi:MAG: SPOR domain-containing protein, partial [Thermodesulfobacteriota bacterium]
FSILLICLGLCGALSFSYYKNMETLDRIDPSMFRDQPPSLGQADHILLLDRQRFGINKLAKGNKGWILPRLGLDHTLEAEHRLKDSYVTRVREDLVAPMDKDFYERIRRLDSNTPNKTVVGYADYAVRRIRILRDVINGQPPRGKEAFEQSVKFLFSDLYTGMPASVGEKFTSIYYDYLAWSNDAGKLEETVKNFQRSLLDISLNSGGFKWLASPAVSKVPELTIADFLKGFDVSRTRLNAAVSGAYTKEGRDRIKEFLQLIESAFPGYEKYIEMENRFWEWYENEFFRQWHAFLEDFPSGGQWKSVTGKWQELGPAMTTPHNPCFLFLEKMAEEIAAFKDNKDQIPAWAGTALRMQHIIELARVEKEREKGSFTAKMEMKKEKLTDKLFGKEDSDAYQDMDIRKARKVDYDLVFAENWNLYMDRLEAVAPATSYPEKCCHMFSDHFAAMRDPAKEDNPFSNVADSLQKLETLFTGQQESPAVFDLLKGPFEYFKTYAVQKSAGVLQDKWEEMVLGASSGIDPDQYHSIMFDSDKGLVWKFINEWADPFITRNRERYLASSVSGVKLPFTNAFFRMLEKGERLSLEHQSSYTVRISTLPAGVNEEARIKPYSNILTLECADKKYELVNNNYPQSETFDWSPETCGDTKLSILFRGMRLEKGYPGKMGFARFLDDFKDGVKRFPVSEFPDQMGHLVESGVSDISISYDISGISPVLKFLHRAPPKLPDMIFAQQGTEKGKYPVLTKEESRHGKKAKEEEESTHSRRIRSLIQQDKTFRITMKTVPMGTNDEAEVKPASSILWMDCDDRVIRLQNNNYPDTFKFEWDPSECGTVLLFIHFPGITLSKEYPDFLAFIDDFNYQSRTFSSRQFPEQREALLEKGVSSFTLGYHFTGELPFLESGDIPTVSDKPEESSEAGKKNGAETEVNMEDNLDGDERERADIFSLDRLLNRSPDNYTIHVAVGQDREKLASFAGSNGLDENRATVYKGDFNGREGYGLVYGVFDSYQQAGEALNDLPEKVKRYSPWIRRFESVFKEID